jgi:hypothetical protein
MGYIRQEQLPKLKEYKYSGMLEEEPKDELQHPRACAIADGIAETVEDVLHKSLLTFAFSRRRPKSCLSLHPQAILVEPSHRALPTEHGA